MDTIGERLRAERGRLGLTQEALARHGGIQKRAQIHYELNQRSPDADYLKAVASIGVDVNFVLTGGHLDRVGAHLTVEESVVLKHWRAASIPIRRITLGVLSNAFPAPSAEATPGHNVPAKGPQTDGQPSPKGR